MFKEREKKEFLIFLEKYLFISCLLYGNPQRTFSADPQTMFTKDEAGNPTLLRQSGKRVEVSSILHKKRAFASEQ